LERLCDFGLVEKRRNNDSGVSELVVHPLVAETNRIWLTNKESAIRACAALTVKAVKAAQVIGAAEAKAPFTVLLPHVLALLEVIQSDRTSEVVVDGFLSSMSLCVRGLIVEGSYSSAELLALRAIASQDRVRAASDEFFSLRLEHAAALRFVARFVDAEREYRAILTDQQEQLAPDHPAMIETRKAIARMLANQGRVDDADIQYTKLLDLQGRVLGVDDPSTMVTRHELARMVSKRGDLERAEEDYRKLLSDEIRVLGP
jgi:tetratricopeptide (TPR) repeat protein